MSRAIGSFVKDNALVLVLMLLFLGSWGGQGVAGYLNYNDERDARGLADVSLLEYLKNGHFWQATGENWESEFLQMGLFVLLTVWFTQKGSPESNDPAEPSDPRDEFPETYKDDPRAPWPVRRGGRWLCFLYAHSLSACFLLLFVVSMLIHALGGLPVYNEEQIDQGKPAVSLGGYVMSNQFWFESFQNWQSEFLSLAAMVWLSVYLRERGSAESKPLAAAHEDHE
jgi:hypothetical protein